ELSRVYDEARDRGSRRGLDAERRDGVDPHHSERCDPGENHLLLLSAGAGVSIRSDIVVRLDRVSKSFGPQKVLDDVTFEIPNGTAFVLLGRSAAGKSVALRHIIGLVRPAAGRALV